MASAAIEYAVPHVWTTCKWKIYTCIFIRIENEKNRSKIDSQVTYRYVIDWTSASWKHLLPREWIGLHILYIDSPKILKRNTKEIPGTGASQKASPRTWLLLPAVASFGAAAEEAGRVSYQWEEAALGTPTSTASVRYSREPRRNRRRRHLGFRGAATNRQEEAAHGDPPPRPPARPTRAAPWPGTATSGPHGAGRCTACRERRRSARVGGGGRRERERGSGEAACTGGGEIFFEKGREGESGVGYLFCFPGFSLGAQQDK